MPFHNRIVACLTLLLVLAACGRAPDGYQRPEDITPVRITPSTPVPILTPPPKTILPFTQELRTNWLTGKPCAPPCWEGITPGKTRLAEAITILNHHPQITQIRVYPALRDSDFGATVEWLWNHTSPHGGGTLDFRWSDPRDAIDQRDVDDPVVARIFVYFASPFSLKTIIDAYGEPSHVVPYAGTTVGIPHSGAGGGRPFYRVTVIYQKRGFYLTAEPYGEDPPRISKDLILSTWVRFFDPAPSNLDEAGKWKWDSADLVPWQGEQDFMSYCRQVRAAEDYGNNCPNPQP